jgi:hypothetical protein
MALPTEKTSCSHRRNAPEITTCFLDRRILLATNRPLSYVLDGASSCTLGVSPPSQSGCFAVESK